MRFSSKVLRMNILNCLIILYFIYISIPCSNGNVWDEGVENRVLEAESDFVEWQSPSKSQRLGQGILRLYYKM